GTIAVDARLTGKISDPRLAGEIRLEQISASGNDLPLGIFNGNGRITLGGDRITLESFTAQANDGNLNASGEVSLAGLRPQAWHFTAVANNVNVIYEGASIIANANLSLTGNPDSQVLSGTVNIPEGDYTTNLDFASMANGSGGADGLSFGSGSGGSTAGRGPLGLPP